MPESAFLYDRLRLARAAKEQAGRIISGRIKAVAYIVLGLIGGAALYTLLEMRREVTLLTERNARDGEYLKTIFQTMDENLAQCYRRSAAEREFALFYERIYKLENRIAKLEGRSRKDYECAARYHKRGK